MRIDKRGVTSLLTKTQLPGADYVINPYLGCSHKCIYCYAEFMKRFSNCNEKWGEYIIVKEPKHKIINKNLKGKTILISSVTDPYNAYNLKFNATRDVLEQLVDSQANIEILTKSKFVLKDLDLIKKIPNIKVGISMNTLDDEFRLQVEPCASSVNDRIETLKMLKNNGIKTYVFISPIFPAITDCESLIEAVKNTVDEIYLENLNLRGSYKKTVMDFIKKFRPSLIELYNNIYYKNQTIYWDNLKEQLINEYLEKNNINYKFYFFHKDIKKN